jgi:hypothetical protein
LTIFWENKQHNETHNSYEINMLSIIDAMNIKWASLYVDNLARLALLRIRVSFERNCFFLSFIADKNMTEHAMKAIVVWFREMCLLTIFWPNKQHNETHNSNFLTIMHDINMLSIIDAMWTNLARLLAIISPFLSLQTKAWLKYEIHAEMKAM